MGMPDIATTTTASLGSQPDPPQRSGPLGRTFLILWTGQTVSTIGSALSAVGIAVYVFVTTGSLAWLGVLTAVEALPVLLMSPLLSSTDRLDRRIVMIRADVLAAIGPAVALAIALTGTIQPWQLAIAGFLGGIGTAFQVPAYQAALPHLVEKPALARANGLVQLGPAAAIVLAPALATAIIAHWGITALLLADLATFAVGIGTTALTQFTAVAPVGTDDDGSSRAALNWLRTDGRGLLVLLATMACINFVMAFFNVAFFALAVDLGGVARAGLAPTLGGVAMIVASIAIGTLGIPTQRIKAFTLAIAAMAVANIVAALRPSFALLILGATIGLATMPIAAAVISTVFHERVPASMHGRVFGLRNVLSQLLSPVGSAAAGLVGAFVAAPAMAPGGALASSAGRVIGVGAERGAALLLLGVAAGLCLLLIPLIFHPAIRSLNQKTNNGSDRSDANDCRSDGPVSVSSHSPWRSDSEAAAVEVGEVLVG